MARLRPRGAHRCGAGGGGGGCARRRRVRFTVHAHAVRPQCAGDAAALSSPGRYALGAATNDAAAAALGVLPRGRGCGSAAELARLIAAEGGRERPLLFVCGDRAREELPLALAGAGVPLRRVIGYGTVAAPDAAARAVAAAQGAVWVVLFSPSGAEAVLSELAAAHKGRVRLAAIGATTAAAIEAAGHAVEAVAQAPTPAGLLDAVLAAD